MDKKLSYLDVIEDVVKFYSENPIERRSYDNENGLCFYYKNGKSCAVGRYINNVQDFVKENIMYSTEGVGTLLTDFGYFKIFKKEVHHLNNKNFWLDLQILHDTKIYWDKNGLTNDGEIYYQLIKKRYEYGKC